MFLTYIVYASTEECCAASTASCNPTLSRSDMLSHHRALLKLLTQLPQDIKDHVTSLCIDGTSSTALLVDSKRGDILAPTKLYNEDQGSEPLKAIKVTFVPCRPGLGFPYNVSTVNDGANQQLVMLQLQIPNAVFAPRHMPASAVINAVCACGGKWLRGGGGGRKQ